MSNFCVRRRAAAYVSILLVGLTLPEHAAAERGTPASFVTRHLVRLKPSQYPETLAFSPDNSLLAVGTADSSILFIRLETGDEIRQVPVYCGNLISLGFSRDVSKLLVIGDRQRQIVDIALGKLVDTLIDRADGVIGLTCKSRNGKWVVQTLDPRGSAAQSGKKIGLNDEITGVGQGLHEPIQSVIGKSASSLQALLRGAPETRVRLEFVSARTQQKSIVALIRQRPRGANDPAADVSGENIVWCMVDGFHSFASAATGKELSIIDLESIGNRVGWPALSSDSRYFAFLGRKIGTESPAIEIHDVLRRKRIKLIDNVRAYIPPGGSYKEFYGLSFTPDGASLLVGGWDRITVYALESGQYEKTFFPQTQLDADSRIGRPGDVEGETLLDQAQSAVAGGSSLKPVIGPNLVSKFALSSHGVLAIADTIRHVTAWDFSTGELLHTFDVPTEKAVSQIGFSGDGKWLAYCLQGEIHIVSAPILDNR